MSCIDWEAVENRKISRKEFMRNLDFFAALYILIFSHPPYQERFTFEDVKHMAKTKWFSKNGIVRAIVDRQTEEIYSYIVAYDVTLEPGVLNAISDVLPNAYNYLYVAELLTAPWWRNNNFASMLVNKLLHDVPERNIIVRTNKQNIASKNLFLKNGFSVLDGIEETIRGLRVGDAPICDTRIFLQKKVCLH